ncbi:MAG: HEPN domain-containing protein [Thermoflexales bacterium]|nr:HEPN domain-containing protein [Thermoflexales bacterium]
MPRRAMDWMRQAERDLRHARNALEAGDYEWACFAAQQAAEKALKALYEHQGLEVRGHSILALLQGLRELYEVPSQFYAFARVLTRYYLEARYPNGFPEGAPFEYFDEEMAQEAVRAAEAILQWSGDSLRGRGGAPAAP